MKKIILHNKQVEFVLILIEVLNLLEIHIF